VIFLVRWVRGRRRRAAGIAGSPNDHELDAQFESTFAEEPTGGLVHRLRSSDVALVAEREIRERLRGRAFRVVTLLLLVVVAGATVIPAITKSTSTAEHVGVVAASKSEIVLVRSVGRAVGARVAVTRFSSPAAAERALRDGTIDLALVGESEILLDSPLSSTDTSARAELARTLSQVVGQERAYASAGLTPAQIAAVSSPRLVPLRSLQPAKPSSPGRSTALIGIILVFVMLTQYNTWTLIGVMEEKSSRVVEVLLAAIRPLQLLAGKVLGIGAVVLAQAGLVVAVALLLGAAVGSDLLTGAAPLVVVTSLLWLVLGYSFFCWVYAAAGSMAERQDQVQTLALPLGLPLIIGYILALTTLSSGSAPIWFQVLGYLPPTAPFAMPALVGLGAVSWWQVVISCIVTVTATVGVARLAAVVYRRAVLRTGRRVGLRELLNQPG